MMDLNVRGLENLVTALNEELKGVPHGPARDEKIREIARAQLAKATSSKEKLFWEAFLRQVGG